MEEILKNLFDYIEKEIEEKTKLWNSGYNENAPVLVEIGRNQVQALMGVRYELYRQLDKKAREGNLNSNGHTLLKEVMDAITRDG